MRAVNAQSYLISGTNRVVEMGSAPTRAGEGRNGSDDGCWRVVGGRANLIKMAKAKARVGDGNGSWTRERGVMLSCLKIWKSGERCLAWNNRNSLWSVRTTLLYHRRDSRHLRRELKPNR